MKLTRDQIHFIDTYLKNSEIEFIDVRMEMVDHVASEVEAKMTSENLDFYNAFKNYMVINKQVHLKDNKKFTKTTDLKVLKALGKLLLKPSSFVLLISFFALFKLIYNYFDVTIILKVAPITILLSLGVFYFISVRARKKERYSGLERIGLILVCITQLVQVLFNPSLQKNPLGSNLNLNIILVSFFLVLAICFVQLVLKYRKEYATLYKKALV